MSTNELNVLPFANGSLWEIWLAEHHAQTPGIWIKMAKKGSGLASVTHEAALEVALCYGWIDSHRKGLDDRYFLQKFTPRRPRSPWSSRNVAKVAQLAAEGRMQPSGWDEVQAARRNGRWPADRV